MTETAQSVTKIIVVAEEEVYGLLGASGASWDLQHRVESISHMWDDLSSGKLDQISSAVVFSDRAFAGEGELEAAIAVMAPHAATFVVTWDEAHSHDLLARVRETAEVMQGADPDAPVYLLSPGSKQSLLDGIRQVFAATGVPVAFPDQYQVETTGPLVLAPEEEPVWAPEPHATHDTPIPPVPEAIQQVAQVVAPVAPAPVAPPVAPTPVAYPAAPSTAPPMPAPGPVGNVSAAHGQADPLDRPVLPGQVTFAVTSSKGGSGKSTTAMMLAAQIAASSKLAGTPKKVVLVDMDTRDGQVASLIGSYMPTALNVRVAPQWDEETILKNLVHDPKLGIDALLAPVRPRTADDVGPDFYRHVIRMLQRTHDVVIMDTSVNYLDPLISTVCLPEATAILFVTTLATTSVQGMARALREITESVENGGMGINRQKIGIVVNQAVTEVGMERDQVLQAALKVPIVGAIPLATRDVLTATNHNRMHLLLKHPELGPAYFKLADVCLPGVSLAPVIGEAAGTPAAAPAAAPTADVPPAPHAAGPEAVEGTGEKKRGLFGRKAG